MRNNQFLFLPLAVTCYCYYMLLLYCCCNNNANIGVQVVKGFRQQSSLSSSSLSQRIAATTIIRRKIKTVATTSATSTLFSLPSRQCSSSSDYLSIPTTTLSMTTTTITIDDKKKFQILGADDDCDEGDEGDGICNIANDYDIFLLDMWGVMHDGEKPYHGVLEVIQKLKNYHQDNENKKKKKLIIVSNSSKRRSNSVQMLHKLGFNENDFDEIITSGEVAHHLLQYLSSSELDEEEEEEKDSSSLSSSSLLSWIPKNIPSPFEDLRTATSISRNSNNNNAFCFGSGDEDEVYLNSCGWTLAENIESANLIVARGTFVIHQKQNENDEDDDVMKNHGVVVDKKIDETLYWKTYQDVLDKAARQQIPMIVCNPDKIRPDVDKSPMPGTIGVAYEELLSKYHGGNKNNDDDDNNYDDSAFSTESLVLYLGKPFPSVYEIALSSISSSSDGNSSSDDIDKSRVVMVGDALETDVTGATVAGFDSIWVINDGIHYQDVVTAANTSIDTTSTSSISSLENGCETVLQDFNQKSESTYAKGRQVSPTFVIPHFRW